MLSLYCDRFYNWYDWFVVSASTTCMIPTQNTRQRGDKRKR